MSETRKRHETMAEPLQPGPAEALVHALHAACHRPAPVVVTARSTAEYHAMVDAFDRSRNRIFPFRNSVIVIFIFINIVILVQLANMWHRYDLNGILILFYGAACALFLAAGYPVHVRPRRMKRRGFLASRMSDSADAVPAQLARLVSGGAGQTSAGLVGDMVSATGGGMHRLVVNAGLVVQLGMNPDKDHEGDLSRRWFRSIENAVAAQVRTPGPRTSMGVLVRAACALSESVDMVSLLDGVAVVLPLGAGDREPVEEPSPYDLSALEPAERTRCLAALQAPGRRDVASLLRLVQNWSPAAVVAVWRAVGLETVVRMLDVPVTCEDDAGRLYRIGPDSGSLCFVRVHDRVQGADGMPLVHWLAVPRHIATPREGVAWSFGMGDTTYRPTAES